jgi:hypothetical protein
MQKDRIAALLFALAIIGYGAYAALGLYRAYGFLLDHQVAATTVAALDRSRTSPTRVALTGHLQVEAVPGQQRKEGLFQEVQTYLYPFRDGSAEVAVLVGSRQPPGPMAAVWGDRQVRVEGVWRPFTANRRAEVEAARERLGAVAVDGFLDLISDDNPLDVEPVLNGGAVVLLCLVAGLGIGFHAWRKGFA